MVLRGGVPLQPEQFPAAPSPSRLGSAINRGGPAIRHMVVVRSCSLGDSIMLRSGLLLCGFILSAGSCTSRAAEPPKVLATGDWSKPVADNRGRALRGRLVL